MKPASSLAAFGLTLSATWLARAQTPAPPATPPPPPIYYVVPSGEVPAAPRGIPAPRNALELSFGTGYTQGFGYLSEGVSMPSVATAGWGLDFGVGYRIDPHWAVLWAGQYQELTAERTNAAWGFTSSIGAQYHFAPTRRVDPWVELGAGYRFLMESPVFGPTVQTHGFQLVHLRAGLDFRADEQFAIGPIFGVDANMFRWQDRPYFTTYINDPRISTFIYAGVQARFDIGGSTRSGSRTYSQR